MGTSNSQHSMDGADNSLSNNQSGTFSRRVRRLYDRTDESRFLQAPFDIVLPASRLRNRDSLILRTDWIENDDDDDDDDDDDEEDEDGNPIPKSKVKLLDTKALEQSEFCMMTKLSCGLKTDKNSQYEKPPPVIKMLSQREVGMKTGCGFSSQDLSTAMNHFLPNDMTIEDRYHHKVFCGTYSQDGNYFLTACQDRKLRLYCTTGKKFSLLRKIAARDVGWSILDTAFSPDGSCCVYSSWSDCVYHVGLFGDSDSQDALHLNPGKSRFCVFSLVFSQDGQEILCGANEGTLYIYDRFSNQRILKIDGHYGDVNTVAYADNTSHILYSGSDDGLCKVWDRRTLSESNPKPVGILAGHMDGITFIEPRGDGRHFLSNSKDQTIKLWDMRVFSSNEGEQETRHIVAHQQWDYRWQKVPTKFKNHPTKLKGDTSVMTYRGHNVLQTLIRCHFSPIVSTGQRYIYTGCARGRIFIYDALTGQPVKILLGHTACVRDVSWHPYKPEITSTSWDTVVARWQHRGDGYSTDDDDDDEFCEKLDSSDSSSSSPSLWARRPRRNDAAGLRTALQKISARLKRRRDH